MVPPSAGNLKFVCSGFPDTRRSLPEANTMRNSPPERLVEGKRHASSRRDLRVQSRRLTACTEKFWISIQSGESPSSSVNPWRPPAANSLIRRGGSAASADGKARQKNVMAMKMRIRAVLTEHHDLLQRQAG